MIERTKVYEDGEDGRWNKGLGSCVCWHMTSHDFVAAARLFQDFDSIRVA